MSHSLAAEQSSRRASAIYSGWQFVRQDILTPALDLIFPPICVGCGKVGTLLCETCLATMATPTDPADPPPSLTALQAVGAYQGGLQQAVHALKYELLTDIAQPLGELMARTIQELNWPRSALVPVPLHDRRLQARGFNQSALLSRVISRLLDWPLAEHSLIRTRDTVSQVGLNRQQRQENVRNAFTLTNPQNFQEPNVVLVDDVFTTGATMHECALTLLAHGTTCVRAIVLGKALRADQR